MKIPVGTETEEKEVHYAEKIKISRPVFMDIPDFLICLAIATCLGLLWQKAEQPQAAPINIHIENNAQK